MATKNLARTVIEGGRSRYNKFDRRYSNRRIRRKTREFARGLRYDPEEGEGRAAPVRNVVGRWHRDRLAAAERWLASFVGRPWDEVRAEIARRFDTRTIAGQHIVFDHLLPSVRGAGRDRHWRPDFAVDDRGILVALPRRRYRSARALPPGKVRRPRREIAAWAAGRKVGRRGPVWFWFEPTGHVTPVCTNLYCRHDQFGTCGRRRRGDTKGWFRQTARLSDDELRFWSELVDEVRGQLEVVL